MKQYVNVAASADRSSRAALAVPPASSANHLSSSQLLVDQPSSQSFSTFAMARFFAALLAAVAMFQVGSAAPYSFPNGTAPAAPAAPTSTGIVNNTIANEVLKRRLRDFPIALARP
ncbi:uncharacterized protein F4822DRAFT_431490 [Hypoxylon trugodes]|uniref:uncharacterized protein n=1 Tax=Hypoxylon trugodes TaxID=326681 RepID=UPI00219E55C9|nr:uncharacterized protein F4822DRAFT_431490 [Hypoxylon trugodes]KAI1386620.1 hypothetical protein F4822DRAFT_431490 [Hypoxylon trugodes]